MKKILITGGCGFIGTNLIARLLKEKDRLFIRVLDNLSVGTEKAFEDVCSADPAPDAELIIGDIRDIKACIRCCEGIDTLVHLAADTGVAPSVENPRVDMEVNVIGTVNLLEAMRERGVERFIFASSGAPLGEAKLPICEESAPKPVSPYGASKLAGEGYCSAYYRTYGIKTFTLRFSNVYGPRSFHKQSVVARFIRSALEGKAIEVYGDGNQTRDFIHVDDLVQAIVLAAGAEAGGEVFQIATSRETTISEIASRIEKIIEAKVGMTTDIAYTGSRRGDVRRNFSDISKAKKILGFAPCVDLAEGLERTVNWFISEGAPIGEKSE
ncbi:MAG: GDP-mannose 4,6-dehydratase [Candidatus Omnitrophica bacterium]|nr:GDP-mannose 4,6-dehydratase [Candidatus Omnitrophota bacterium]